MILIKEYYRLAKPGIVYGNLITASAGFFLASKGNINFQLLVATLIGIALIIGSSCVFNNYIDRGIDEKMPRTKNRALVKGTVSPRNALIYATVLGILGFLVLAIYTNFITVIIGSIGVFFYIVMYSIWKRRSIYGTIVGSVSGAVPIVAGYTAVTNHFDMGAFLIFMILVLWQMPHFYAIAIYRLKDYTAAKIPVLPVKKGIFITKIHMLSYIIAFIIAVSLLTILGFTGYIYLSVALALGGSWLLLCIKGFKTNNDAIWARKMFFFSLITITLLSVVISIDALVKNVI